MSPSLLEAGNYSGAAMREKERSRVCSHLGSRRLLRHAQARPVLGPRVFPVFCCQGEGLEVQDGGLVMLLAQREPEPHLGQVCACLQRDQADVGVDGRRRRGG